ncbi:MAG: outer membrane beta-barrel protein [Bacteroidales bacterium]|jgi:hypothetical protein|nr:PorT family protein [Bacteroidales bacterium]
MKKILVVIFLLAISAKLSYSQENNQTPQEKKKSNFNYADLIIKDRIFVDVFSSRWINFNTNEIKQRAINQGVNACFIFDFPVKKNSPFSFGVGIGVTHHNLFSNAYTYIDTGYTTAMKVIDTNRIKYDKNALSFTNLNIPLEFRYFHKSGFKIALGVRVGLMVDVHTKYYGRNIDGKDKSEKLIDKKIPNATKVPVEITFRTGWKYFGFNASYMVTKLFEAGKGPQMYPLNLGISISLY